MCPLREYGDPATLQDEVPLTARAADTLGVMRTGTYIRFPVVQALASPFWISEGLFVADEKNPLQYWSPHLQEQYAR